MAKRAEIAGQGLIILDATGVADRYGTNERLAGAGSRVLHRFGSRVLIGDMPARVARKATATAGVRSAHAGAVAKPPGRLNEVEALGVAAWNLRVSPEYARAKEERPHDGLRWDAVPGGGPLPPDGPGMTHVDDTPAGALGRDRARGHEHLSDRQRRGRHHHRRGPHRGSPVQRRRNGPRSWPRSRRA